MPLVWREGWRNGLFCVSVSQVIVWTGDNFVYSVVSKSVFI